MSKWVSDIISDKQQRQAEGARKHGHLQAFEGGKVLQGVTVGDSVINKIRRFFRPKASTPQLRVLKSTDEQQ